MAASESCSLGVSACGCKDTPECCAARHTLAQAMYSGQVLSGGGVINIPLIFNCTGNLSQANDPNLTDSQLEHQVRQLNLDFAARNHDRLLKCPTSMVASLAPDARINFYIQDIRRRYVVIPHGLWHSSETHELLFGQAPFRETMKWDTRGGWGINATYVDTAINIWCCYFSRNGFPWRDGEGVTLGYAYFPSNGPAANDSGVTVDGIVMQSQAIGAYASPAPVSNFGEMARGGRILAHEVGHYLGLPHSWGHVVGRASCDTDETVTDLPLSSGPFPWSRVANPPAEVDLGCGPEPYCNHMNYGGYLSSFTVDQVARMRAVRAYTSRRRLGESVRPVKLRTVVSLAVGRKYADRAYYGANLLWQDSTVLPDPPPPPPGAPVWSDIAAGDGAVQLSWIPPAHDGAISGYELQSSSDGGATWTPRGSHSTPSASVSGLTNNISVVFRVRATSGVTPGLWSDESSSVTPTQSSTALPNWLALSGEDNTGNAVVIFSCFREIEFGSNAAQGLEIYSKQVAVIAGGGEVTHSAASRDGRYIALTLSKAPHLVIYKRSDGGVWQRLPDVSPPIPGEATVCQWNGTGSRIAVGHDSAPYLSIRDNDGSDKFVASSLAFDVMPTGKVLGLGWSPRTRPSYLYQGSNAPLYVLGSVSAAGEMLVTYDAAPYITAYRPADANGIMRKGVAPDLLYGAAPHDWAYHRPSRVTVDKNGDMWIVHTTQTGSPPAGESSTVFPVHSARTVYKKSSAELRDRAWRNTRPSYRNCDTGTRRTCTIWPCQSCRIPENRCGTDNSCLGDDEWPRMFEYQDNGPDYGAMVPPAAEVIVGSVNPFFPNTGPYVYYTDEPHGWNVGVSLYNPARNVDYNESGLKPLFVSDSQPRLPIIQPTAMPAVGLDVLERTGGAGGFALPHLVAAVDGSPRPGLVAPLSIERAAITMISGYPWCAPFRFPDHGEVPIPSGTSMRAGPSVALMHAVFCVPRA